MDLTVLAVYTAVYAGMVAGRVPGLALDRTGVALLGVIVLMVTGRVGTAEAWAFVDVSTVTLLLSLMVVSSQFRLSGFYSWMVRRIAVLEVGPPALAALLVLVTGALSAILANDIVCLAVAPVLVEGCRGKGLDPRPFLLALACAANVGSAATLIGNPQNMLVGQTMEIPFAGYMSYALLPSAEGLAVVWAATCLGARGRWRRPSLPLEIAAPPFDPWQTAKGAAVVLFIVVAFVLERWPREVVALAGAGLLLCSRRMRSREMLGLVDWQLLLLFASLFVLNGAMERSGNLAAVLSTLQGAGIDLRSVPWLFAASAVLSNVVSNVPAVMLLLPATRGAFAGVALALSSTLAGNLFLVGSIANLIVVDQASRLGEHLGWRDHARVGVPVTLLTLGMSALWLWMKGP